MCHVTRFVACGVSSSAVKRETMTESVFHLIFLISAKNIASHCSTFRLFLADRMSFGWRRLTDLTTWRFMIELFSSWSSIVHTGVDPLRSGRFAKFEIVRHERGQTQSCLIAVNQP